MRSTLILAIAFVLASPLGAQDQSRTEEILRRVEAVLKTESDRVRTELLDLIRRELRGTPAPKGPDPAPAVHPEIAGNLDKAKELITAELLRRHATYLASDELEGRCSGYPGNDKAAEYIVGIMKQAGLKPAGDEGSYTQKFKVSGKETRNCLGLIEGSDPERKGEIVVVGAHYDHVGTSDQKDFGRLPGRGGSDHKIWNGADDNGSGTSVVLGLIRAFAEGGLRGKRSILFILFSGEEAGLIGSRWYTNHPLAPIGQHVYMLNLDMVGRNPHRAIEIQGVGSAQGGVVRGVVERAVEKSGLKAALENTVTLAGGDSDHSSFQDKRVPFTFFFSGFHADYHRPSDTADKLAYDNMVKVAQAAAYILYDVSNLAERPKFAGPTSGLKIPDIDPAHPPRRLGVTVQELDDSECDGLGLEKDQGGLRIENVQQASAAETAGMKAGDVVLSVLGEKLPRNSGREALRKILADKVQAGMDVPLMVLRKGEKLSLKAKWTE